MVARTSIEPHAPWHLIPPNRSAARVAVIDTVTARSRRGCGGMG